jgi:hypothetical protein
LVRYTDLRLIDSSTTALLQAIAEKLIPGVPENLTALLVGQIEEHDDEEYSSAGKTSTSPPVSLSVLEKVIKSDKNRENVLKEFESGPS